jgi:hypothetical protein
LNTGYTEGLRGKREALGDSRGRGQRADGRWKMEDGSNGEGYSEGRGKREALGDSRGRGQRADGRWKMEDGSNGEGYSEGRGKREALGDSRGRGKMEDGSNGNTLSCLAPCALRVTVKREVDIGLVRNIMIVRKYVL